MTNVSARDGRGQHPFIRLLGYARQYRRRIGTATFFSVFNKIFDLAPPVLIGAAVDIVVQRDQSFLGKLGVSDPMAQLVVLAAITFVVWMLESAFQYSYQIYWRNLAQSIEHDIRVDAYRHVQNLEVAYFEDRSTGGLMSVLNDDINQLERFLDSGANYIIQVVTSILLIGALFFISAPNVAWLAIVPMPFVIYGSIWFQKRLKPRYVAVREQVGILNGQLNNNLTGIATIKSYTAEDYEVERIRAESDRYRTRNGEAIRWSSAFVPLIRIFIVCGFIAIMIFGGQSALEGRLAVATYSILVFMTQRLLWPLTALGEMLDLYQRAMASIVRILNLLETKPTINDGDQALPTERVRGAVAFDDVTFKYNTSANILDGLTFKIEAGQSAALVGPTGAGKSTIVKLLLRLYDVTGGRVTLDGHDVRGLDLRDLRRAVGYVSQDIYLFHGTVRENIAYGTFDAPDDRIVAAAKAAEAHDFIMALPDGYDTVVGERGQKLSGGQRQRISIARAVLKDPPVLIFDEATSSVDNETEAAIQRSLEKIAVGRTTIVIAHRLSTVRNADVIFVVEQGALHEVGTHDDLVRAGGLYAALWRVQMGERTPVSGG